jgi:hypothetical protein
VTRGPADDTVGEEEAEEARVDGDVRCDAVGVGLVGVATVDGANPPDVSAWPLAGGGAVRLELPLLLASAITTLPVTSAQNALTQAINALRDRRIDGHRPRR